MISLIAAVSKNGVIGNEGDLPWNLPSDLKKFKEITDNKPIIMGRKTWDSIGRPLPNRDNIVISRNVNLEINGGIICSSPDEAISIAKIKANERGGEELMVIGGGYIYKEFMDVADKLYITEVDLEVKGDAYFPKIDLELFNEVSREEKDKMAEDKSPIDSIIIDMILEKFNIQSMTGVETRITGKEFDDIVKEAERLYYNKVIITEEAGVA